jgi:hypothetical protein
VILEVGLRLTAARNAVIAIAPQRANTTGLLRSAIVRRNGVDGSAFLKPKLTKMGTKDDP